MVFENVLELEIILEPSILLHLWFQTHQYQINQRPL